MDLSTLAEAVATRARSVAGPAPFRRTAPAAAAAAGDVAPVGRGRPPVPPRPGLEPAAEPDAGGQAPSLWRFLAPTLRPHAKLIGLALALSAAHGVAITFQNMMPKYLIDSVLQAGGVSTRARWVRLGQLVAAYLFACIVARMLVWHLGYRVFTWVREKVLFTMRADFFRHVNRLCMRYHTATHSGETFSYLFGSPLGQVQAYFQAFTFGAPGAVVVLVSTLVWLGAWDPVLSGVLVASVLSTVVLMNRTRRKVQAYHNDYQQTETTVTGYVADLLRGGRDVKLYAMEQQAADDFGARVWQVGQKAYDRDVKSHVQWMKQETIGYCAFAALCAACAWRYLHDQSHPVSHPLTIGEVQAYLTAFGALQGSLTTLFQLSTQRGAAQAGLNRIDAVLKTVSTTPDPLAPRAVPSRGEIALHNVTFGYTGDRPVLRSVDLRIPYGQKVALVGPSGAGKSTVTQLLLRLYDPDHGSVTLDGVDLRHLAGGELRRRFGVVPQDPFIFRASVRTNLTVARPDATDAQVRTACDRANAWEYIARLPDGLDTMVGEGGNTLSGGQRQRMAIARALLADPDYFIFDEATSALDTVSEHLVQRAMENAGDGRTSLVIAHRLATVRNCDRILVCDGGRIAQDGTYDQLLARPGLFRDLVQGQVLRS